MTWHPQTCHANVETRFRAAEPEATEPIPGGGMGATDTDKGRFAWSARLQNDAVVSLLTPEDMAVSSSFPKSLRYLLSFYYL